MHGDVMRDENGRYSVRQSSNDVDSVSKLVLALLAVIALLVASFSIIHYAATSEAAKTHAAAGLTSSP